MGDVVRCNTCLVEARSELSLHCLQSYGVCDLCVQHWQGCKFENCHVCACVAFQFAFSKSNELDTVNLSLDAPYPVLPEPITSAEISIVIDDELREVVWSDAERRRLNFIRYCLQTGRGGVNEGVAAQLSAFCVT